MTIRKLKEGDEQLLEKFLSGYTETSMFLRSNLHASGLSYKGENYQGEYLASFLETGDIEGVLAHYWNGNIMMQVPNEKVLRELISAFKKMVIRPIAGILGENSQAEIVMSGLNILNQKYAVNRSEGLYVLDLTSLSFPSKYTENNYDVIEAGGLEKSLLIEWLRAYDIEALGAVDNVDLDTHVENKVDRLIKDSNCWVLIINGRPVSLSGFNASLPDIVQIGPVWTPPEYRNKGYGRTLVALTLLKARRQGVTKAILFTDNPAAVKAYEAIGFRKIGLYRLALLKKPIILSN